MDESKTTSNKTDQKMDSDLEQNSSMESKDASIVEDKEKTERTRNRGSKKNVEDRGLNLKKIFNFPLLSQNAVTWIDCTNFYLCNLCQCSILGINQAYVHITQDFHKQKLKEKMKKSSKFQNKVDVLKNHNHQFWCEECQINIETEPALIQSHCLLHFHESLPKSHQDIFQYSITDGKRYLKCSLCNVTADNDKILAEHMTSSEHLQKLDLLYNMNEKVSWDDLNVEDIHNEKSIKTIRFKPVIQSSDSDMLVLTVANNKKNPPKKVERSKVLVDLTNHTDLWICWTCNKKVNNSKLLIRHLNSMKHKRSLNSNKLVINDCVNNFIQPLDYTKFFLRLSMHGILKSELDTSEIKRPDKKSKNIAYQEDVKNFGNQYILMCIDNDNRNTKSIYKLDSDELNLLKLGISLIFTFDSHRVCVPCGYKLDYPLELTFEHLQHEVHLQNLKDMENNAKESQDKFNLMYLAKACIGVHDESKEYLKCYVCETSVRDTDLDIEEHLKSPDHVTKMRLTKNKKQTLDKVCNEIVQEIWYYAERFFCDLCNVDYEREISFAGHLNHPEHLEKVKNDTSNSKINICYACSTCWYGIPCYSEHCQRKVHARCIGGFHLFVRDSVRKLVKLYDKKTAALVRESSSCSREKDLLLLKCMDETVKSVYPDARAYTFGSRFAGLGSCNSDVDVFLDCENNYYEFGSQEKSTVYMKKIVKSCFQKQRNIWKIERVLMKTRVPIIKLEHRPTRLKCDISFLNGLGVEKSRLIRTYVMVHPICQHFMLFLKAWFQACKLYGSQGINGYAVTWFAIFYLQVKGFVPSVYQLIRQNNKSMTIDGWECGFANIDIPEHIFAKDSSMTLFNLIKGFFVYYAKFKYRDEVACPLLGKIMKKKSFVVIDNLPEEMDIYKERMKQIETEHFRYDSPLAIQDPVDLSQNITKAVTKTQLRQFRYCCTVGCMQIGRK